MPNQLKPQHQKCGYNRADEIARRSRGFTLLELLITMGIIFLLAGIVVVTLRSVRLAANRSQTSSTLRQMALAYTAYSTDHNQALMPGYMSADAIQQLGITTRLSNDVVLDPTLVPNDASSYVWRLSPYLDHNWEEMFVDYRHKELMEHLHQEFDGGIYGPGTAMGDQLGISRIPSIGLNAIFLGGDDVHGGDYAIDRNPWSPVDPSDTLAATRFTEIKNPAKIVLFAPTVHQRVASGGTLFTNPPVTKVEWGYGELRPPMLGWDANQQPIQPQWAIATGGFTFDGDFTEGGGLPISRWGKDLVPVAHPDGSIGVEQPGELGSDLRKWSPFVVGY